MSSTIVFLVKLGEMISGIEGSHATLLFKKGGEEEEERGGKGHRKIASITGERNCQDSTQYTVYIA